LNEGANQSHGIPPGSSSVAQAEMIGQLSEAARTRITFSWPSASTEWCPCFSTMPEALHFTDKSGGEPYQSFG